MKIIVEGKKPDRAYPNIYFECSHCKTVFVTNTAECVLRTTGFNENGYFYRCPICESERETTIHQSEKLYIKLKEGGLV